MHQQYSCLYDIRSIGCEINCSSVPDPSTKPSIPGPEGFRVKEGGAIPNESPDVRDP